MDRTSRLANQLLSLSRLEAGNVDIQKQPVSLSLIIDDVCQDLESICMHKSISINKTIDPSVQITADRDMMYMLIRNLLENSIRYSQPETEIEMSLIQDTDNLQLILVDNGPGIPEQSLPRVFDRFYRDINTGESGSGLGLAIVKRISELHDIHLTLANRPEQNGLKVTLVFQS